MIANQYGHDVTQMAHDIAEIVEAARAGGRKLADATFAAIVRERNLLVFESVMLSDKARNAIKANGIVLWRKS